jgi:hypothetical protein
MAKAKSKANNKPKSNGPNRRRSFITSPAYGVANQGVERFDNGGGVIRGLAVCTEGEAKGHGVQLDSEFIAEVTKHGARKSQGIKARFGHPSMSGTALGTFVGRSTNFRTDRGGGPGGGDITRADLNVDPIANDSPEGKLGDYVLGLAESDPKAFGMSIVFRPGETYKRDAQGRKVTRPTGDPGSAKYRKARDKWADCGGPEYATLEKLHASDLVDDPAANPDGLFSAFATDSTIAGQVSEFLDNNPEIFAAVESDPAAIEGFIERYRAYVIRRTAKGPDAMAKNKTDDKALDDNDLDANDGQGDDAQGDQDGDDQGDQDGQGDDAQGDQDGTDSDAGTSDDDQGDDAQGDDQDDAEADATEVLDPDKPAPDLGDDQGDDDQDGDDQGDQAQGDDAQGDQAQADAEPADKFAEGRKELGRFVELFGAANAAEWFAAGLTLAEAQGKYAAAQVEKIAALTRELKAAKADRGLDEALTFEGDDDPVAEAEAKEYDALVKAFGGNKERAQQALDDRKKARAQKAAE